LTTELGKQAPESFTYTKLNPSIGITHVSGPLTWRANAEQGNRVPTAIELGCADPAAPCRLPVGLQSDPYLKQVVARTVEAGVRAHWDRVDADLTLFRTVNLDDILFVGAGATSHAGYFANFERTLHQGAGLGVTVQWGGAQWRLDYSYLRATYDAAGSLFTGARIVQVEPGTAIAGLPRHTLKLGVDWEPRAGLALGADLQAQSAIIAQGNEDGLISDPDDAARPQRGDWSVRGFALLNLHASWKLAPGWELFGRVSNALNRRYETYAAIGTDMFPGGRLLRPDAGPAEPGHARFVAPGAPRLVTAGLRYRF
jgi:outer membrane receptor protein involved in Fe transport